MTEHIAPPAVQRVLLAGGAGFLGRHLAARLAAAGHYLRVPTRRSGRVADLEVLPRLQLLRADITDPATLRQLLRGCDAVVNLVGILNEAGHDGSGFRAVHTEFTTRLVAAAREQGVRRLVQISALGADAGHGPSHYLRSKGAAEQAIAAQAGPLAWSILQPSVIYGPGDAFLNRFGRLLQLTPLVFPLACPEARFAPVHVADVVSAIVRCLQDPDTAGHRYQLCGGEAYSLRELVQMTARQLDLRRQVIGLPDGLARLQARIMEHLPGKPFSMDNYRSLSVPSVCTRDGLAELGITPRSLAANLSDCLPPPRRAQRQHTRRQVAGR